MMKVIVEGKNVKTLRVGDALIDDKGKLNFVVDNTGGNYKYSIKAVWQYHGAMLSSDDLETLTNDALRYGFIIYYQDDYELVLRKK